MSLSVIILTKNEEKNIDECLASLDFCDERIVIDDNSTDATVARAKKHGTVVMARTLGDNFAAQRNFGLEKAKGEWVLFIDADERVSQALAKEIQEKIQAQDQVEGYFVKRLDNMWGRVLRHGEQGDIRLLRLVKKGTGKWTGKVHEIWQTHGSTEHLTSPLLHFPHPTVSEFLQEINLYSTLRAKELHEQKTSVSFFSIILYPKAKFVQDYIVKAGFLDGTAGFIVAMLMSLHSFLVRGKLWQLNQK